MRILKVKEVEFEATLNRIDVTIAGKTVAVPYDELRLWLKDSGDWMRLVRERLDLQERVDELQARIDELEKPDEPQAHVLFLCLVGENWLSYDAMPTSTVGASVRVEWGNGFCKVEGYPLETWSENTWVYNRDSLLHRLRDRWRLRDAILGLIPPQQSA